RKTSAASPARWRGDWRLSVSVSVSDQTDLPVGRLDLDLRLLRQLRLRRPGMRMVTDGQTEHGGGVLERPAPVGEVVRTPRITGEPRTQIEFQLIHPGLLGMVHRLDQPAVENQ